MPHRTFTPNPVFNNMQFDNGTTDEVNIKILFHRRNKTITYLNVPKDKAYALYYKPTASAAISYYNTEIKGKYTTIVNNH